MTKIHTTAAVRPAAPARKELKQPDQFVTTSARALEWAKAHQAPVIGAAAAVVGIGVVAAIAMSLQAARLRDANADLGAALAVYRDAADSAEATAKLNEVARRWSGESVGQMAAFVAGSAELGRGNFDTAIVSFGEAASTPRYLTQAAAFETAFALEAKGDAKEALEHYNAAAAQGGPYTSLALRGAARVQEALGQPAEAKKIYERLVREFPNLPDKDQLAGR